ncbi:uncharacterized protein LOC110617319 [Manihot esculenta]|uniref:uncharacterized protein LOC110617319 n=1 Tax=Manihot esculenta TaxID=3983 RepID=UPI001CC6A62C|nr:uncharacterized protein LOC110617319 [Manihot esculenta]
MASSLTARPSRISQGTWTSGTSSPRWPTLKPMARRRTTPRTLTKETPFTLAFGTEAVVPIELQIPSHCVQFNNEDTNGEKLRSNLDVLEEISKEAQMRTTAYQQKAARYYNQRVSERSLKVGDLALRKLEATRKRAAVGKLTPT